MKATELLAMYERVADAPDAVGKLRRFVLDLAVRGKLVEQRARDDGARLLGVASADVLTMDEAFALPRGWRWLFVRDVATTRLGKMLDKSKNKGAPRRYLRNINVRWFDFDLSDLAEMRFEDSELSEFELRLGDVLICEGGEPGRAAVWDERVHGVYFQKAIHRVRFDSTVIPSFFVLSLKASANDGRLAEYFTGTGIKHFTGKGLQSYRFPCPSIAEQHRIVAKVDELMALCDQLEAARTEREAARDRLAAASLARLNAPDPDTFQADARFALNVLPAFSARPDQVKQLRQTILNLAVRGKLVAQALSAAKSQKTANSNSGGPDTLPPHWRLEPLEALLSEDTRNGYSRRPDDAPNGTPILRISAGTVRRDGIVAEEQHKMISGIDADAREQYAVRAGDLLACRFNGNKAFVGRLTLFEDYLKLLPIYPDKLIRVRVDQSKVLAGFIRLAGESDLVRSEVEAQCATTVGNWGISASNLKRIRFPVPPLAEQHRIVAKVGELMTLCDQLEASLANGESTRSRLLDSLLHNALGEFSLAAA